MAKQDSDYITLDLFENLPKAGRPRTNPLSREQQVRINKRNQLKRERSSGVRRIELKLHSELVQRLEQKAYTQGVSRQRLMEQILTHYVNAEGIDFII